MTQLDAPRLHEHHVDDVSFDAEGGADPHDARVLVGRSQNDSPPANEPSVNDNNTSAEAAKVQSNLKLRKRTKTGCLTCRKRRIKCGEERPTCANCIKSKRSCEGYAPRLTFKDPLGAFRPGWGIKGHGAHFPGYPHPNGAIGQYARQPMPPGTQSQLPIIAPRPLPSDVTREVYSPQHLPASAWSFGLQNSHQHDVPISIQPSTDLPPRMRQIYQSQNGGHGMQYTQSEGVNAFSAASYVASVPAQPQIPQDVSRFEANRPPVPSWPLTNAPNELNEGHLQPPTSFVDRAGNLPATTMPTEYYHSSGPTNEIQDFDGFIGIKQPEPQMQSMQLLGAPQHAHHFNGITHSLQHPAAYTWAAQDNKHCYDAQNNSHQVQSPLLMHSSTKLFRNQMGHETIKNQFTVDNDESEDDMFDVESDEEELNSTHRIALTPQNNVGLVLALAASQDDRALRSYTTFLHEPNVLSNYHPTYTASPLMDSITARVFCHFITATGPSISIYERHPTNPSVMFTGAPVPSSQQALWTYTLPMRALSNQALLHAMLAMSSLHISALQKTPPTASLRHYHYCLRKLSRALAVPSRRTDVCTIAATLILAHYEATTAEHSKWNRHLAGARQLLMEVDFKGITKQIREEKARRSRQKEYPIWYYSRDTLMNHDRFEQNPEVQNDDSADEILVSQLMGYKINYNEFGRIVDDRAESSRTPLTEKDKETYRIHCDLFWWYAKQDVYQSIVSGNRLLLPYDRWGHCPPRAPIGKLDAIYGTMDHVVLLMGRIADFASKDQIRKRRLVKMNGGSWIPPPGMFHTAPPEAPPPSFPPHQTRPPGAFTLPTQPPMYGMIPPTPPPQTPERFMQIPRDQIYIPPVIDEDILGLEDATSQAEHEWQEIQDALNLLEKSFGPAYAPLPDYLTTPIQTPFGPALQFRTWSIADIWVMYYTGRIVAARTHPSMPPAAMMAAGVAARQTAHWANEIGRICCGLQIPPADQPLNPAVGAALMESTLGMFFAGVQLTDPLQRSTIITRLVTIADMTGLQSSALIAAGCELCWSKMGEAGRGPPYQSTMDRRAKDDRVAGRQAQEGHELNRKMVYFHPTTRTHYGMGILSFDEDIHDSIRQDLKELKLVKY